jgi:hypothetical protein
MWFRVRTNAPGDAKRYKLRGIKICESWRDFEPFITDLGPIPHPKYSLDRIDNNGDYCAENCRWADAKTQARNRSNNLILEFRGQKHTAAEWSEILGFGKNVLINRLYIGWSVEKALSTPQRKRKPRAV